MFVKFSSGFLMMWIFAISILFPRLAPSMECFGVEVPDTVEFTQGFHDSAGNPTYGAIAEIQGGKLGDTDWVRTDVSFKRINHLGDSIALDRYLFWADTLLKEHDVRHGIEQPSTPSGGHPRPLVSDRRVTIEDIHRQGTDNLLRVASLMGPYYFRASSVQKLAQACYVRDLPYIHPPAVVMSFGISRSRADFAQFPGGYNALGKRIPGKTKSDAIPLTPIFHRPVYRIDSR